MLDRPRNTRYRKRIYDDARPDRKKPIPRRFVDNPNWIRITDSEQFKEIFPLVCHEDADYLEDYFVVVHKLDPAFTEGKFGELKDDFLRQMQDKLINIFFKKDITQSKVDKMTIYELVDLAERELGYTISLDFNDVKVICTAPADTWTKKEHIQTLYGDMTRDELRKIAKSKGLSQSGTKSDLIARITK